ncbi:hypothetical protein HYH03_017255 [Edaphochlamys debaryana]|uniref:Uncharacterized protein n=1 Tax=Edaphochlamys debaryana TaxID=47281 RepID=A0A835XN04_9CHLO|nr:hypothetical protein HYH03_017255 [Edaphochlamys debaryana]|eukprot:KAG2483935.1 hypothetical protein HYH03_017255 [Edaphochlamys debaryana]
MKCATLQAVPECGLCVVCGSAFGEAHACSLCRIYSHDPGAGMWHCEACGICRRGGRENFVHCKECGGCVRRDVSHTCAPLAMHRECAVCRTYLFDSRMPVTALPGCGHLAVHSDCLAQAQAQAQAQRERRTDPISCPHCTRKGTVIDCCGVNDVYDLADAFHDGIMLTRRVITPASEIYLAPRPREYMRRINNLPSALVVPPEEESRAASQAVHRVTQVLQTLPTVRVDRVHRGGSSGRKTSVRVRSDVDMLAMVTGLDPVRQPYDTRRMFDEVVCELERRLGVKVKGEPARQLCQLSLGGVKLDVLLARNVCGQGDSDKAATQVRVLVKPLFALSDAQIQALAAAGPDPTRERAVCEAHTAFVARQHKTANEAAWVKCGLAERGLLASKKLASVALELIALQAYQEETGPGASKAFEPTIPDTSLLLRVLLRSLETASRFDQPRPAPVVMVDAAVLGYRPEQGMRFRPCWGPLGPFIIHPIDPTCNVARDPDNGKAPWDWAGLARASRVLLTVLRYDSLAVLLRESSLGAALYRLRLREEGAT